VTEGSSCFIECETSLTGNIGIGAFSDEDSSFCYINMAKNPVHCLTLEEVNDLFVEVHICHAFHFFDQLNITATVMQ